MSLRSSKLAFGVRTIVAGGIIALLATTVGATALGAQPKDAAVSRTALRPLHPAVDNTSRTSDLGVTSTTNTTIVSAVMNLGVNLHGCEVTATAEIDRTVNGTGTYVFSLGQNSTTSTTSSERRLEFVATSDTDVIWGNAATSQGYDDLSGTQTFNFLVRKDFSSAVNTTVTNATISVVCTDTQL
jgi:hypothetical protein